MIAETHRCSIFVEEADILAHDPYPANQYIMRLHAPKCAAHALPGSFIHLRCDPLLLLRRPFSIMRASQDAGWIEILYKKVGLGTFHLSKRVVGERLSIMGPIGKVFEAHRQYPFTLLLGGGVGIPPMIFMADKLRSDKRWRPLVIMGSEVPFPFQSEPSQIPVSGLPDGVSAAMPLLEEWGTPSRLTSLQGYPGCYQGYITELAQNWLDHQDHTRLRRLEIFGCGPEPMLRAVAALARDYRLPCQLSLEEYMACAVGGCAGCTVNVKTQHGFAMKRVCVDGPVFTAEEVFY